MGVISSRIRRHRRTRLAAEMACTWNPRRLFPLGQEQGGVYYPDDPNALLRRVNQLSATATLSTQSITATPRQQTLSFKGTGTVTLSGASTAGPLVGTGASDRVTLTFTPTAASLTLTVTGTVTEAQLELGPAFTTYQPVTTWTTDYMAAVGHLVTQFTDSAGTTPVTKVTDPVGLTLDRRFGLYRGPQLLTSGAIGLTGTATAATYSTTTGAGTVTRVDASNQSWVQFSGLTAGRSYQITVSGVSGGTLQVRDGSATGTVIASTTSGTPCLVTATGTTITLTASAAATVAFTVTQIQWLPGNHRIQSTSGSRKTLSARYNLLLATATMATQNVTTVATSYKLSFTGTGTVTLSGTSTAGPLVGTGASVRVSLTFTPTAGTLTLTVSGSVTLADLRTADDAAKAIPAYQRVNTASDYDTDGYPFFWLYDGTDDSDATASTVDGSASDKVTVIAGIAKLSDAAAACVIEHTATSASNDGSFILSAPTAAAVYQWRSKGTALSDAATAASYPAPHSGVLTGVGDIANDTSALRIGGAQVATAATDQGTGTYANATTYFGRRGASSLPFNGREYAIIERFGPMSDSERNQAERWVAQRMGVTI